MQLPDPTDLTWLQWASTAAGFNPAFGQYVNPNMSWQDYGRSLTYLLPQAPRTEWFGSWQDWARALRQAVSS